MSRPRVLLVSPVSDFKGGAEVVLRTMLANPYIEPVLAVPEEGAIATEAAAKGIPVCYFRPSAMMHVHRPPRPGPILAAVADAVRCAFRLQRLAREHGCVVLHSNGLKPHLLCALLGAVTRTKTLVHLHDIPYRRSERAIWRAIARGASQVIIVSRPCYPGPVLPPNVQVVRNGIAMVCDTLPEMEMGTPLRLGFVGRYHPNKGLDLLLDWFAAVRGAGIDATLTLRGRADPDLPDYWPGIQARIRDEGLSGWIRDDGWVAGAGRFAGLDVLLVPSKTPDPAPLVVPEAMSAGVVVAGYPAGGIPGMIDDGRTGLIADDGQSLVRKLTGFVNDPASFHRVRRDAYDDVLREYGSAGFHTRLRDVYQAMIS